MPRLEAIALTVLQVQLHLARLRQFLKVKEATSIGKHMKNTAQKEARLQSVLPWMAIYLLHFNTSHSGTAHPVRRKETLKNLLGHTRSWLQYRAGVLIL